MEKRKILKIGLLVMLFLLCFFCIFNIVETAKTICSYEQSIKDFSSMIYDIENDIIEWEDKENGLIDLRAMLSGFQHAKKSNTKELFFPIVLLCLSIACIVYLIKGSNCLNKAKLTYEEYKELSQKKKAEKQAKNKAKKKEKLENKLKRLE